ncbi:MAG TPA: tetratricopeptide repeat protein [Pseudonocardiaceae bacterium]
MEIRLLGGVEIGGDTDTVRLRRSGERCVLAVLALNVRASVTVSTLVDHLWSGTGQSDKSIDTVSTYLRNVRTALKQAGGHTGLLRYNRVSHSCVLDVDPTWVDYHRFTALVALARRDNEPSALREALALWRGPALADVSGHWADHRRHILESERLTTYEDLLHHDLTAGRYAEIVRVATGLVEESIPTDRLLLLGAQGLAGSGQYTAIRGWVARVTQRMRDTVDAAPSAEVLAEIDRLIASPTSSLTPSAGSPPTAMFSLRADIPTFIGREDELRKLLDAVKSALDGPYGAMRTVMIYTVHGMAGVGKTVFSVHAAHYLADQFPDGNLFLELHGHTLGQTPVPPGEALDSLLRAVGVDPIMIPPKLEDRARLWRDRMAGKKILLVLDDAADHDQVRLLLPGTAGSLVLITSRHRLPALDGTLPVTLDVLPPADAVDLLRRLAGLDDDEEDEPVLAEIVARCGYLPLAISLAGAQLRNHPSWTIRYLADLLVTEHHLLEHLRAGDRSVTAAFTMSFHQLPAAQQRLFRLLGIHPGPEIDAYAAAALTGSSPRDAQRWLEALHTDHLIQETAPGRYQLHDLIRAYTQTLAADLDPDDRKQALHRVLTYYQCVAHTANAHLPVYYSRTIPPVVAPPAHVPSVDTDAEAQAWLTAELPTLSACIRHADVPSDKQQAIHLAMTLHPFLRLNGYTEQALHIYATALDAAVDIGDRMGQADALTNLGDVQHQRNQYELAADSFTDAVELFGALSETSSSGATLGTANALTGLGAVRYQWREYEVATANFARALNLYTALGDRRGQAKALDNLGQAQYQRGEYDAAIHCHARALALFTELDFRTGKATALLGLGRATHRRGQYQVAAHNLNGALELFTELGDPHSTAETLNSLGELALDHPDGGDPHDYFSHALTIACDIGSAAHKARALAGQAHCLLRTTRTDAAVVLFREARSIYRSLDVPEAAEIENMLATLEKDAG